MKRNFRTSLLAAALVGAVVPAIAEENEDFFARNVLQQERIEQGLRAGDLTTREAAQLEYGQSRVGRMEAQALRDGTLSDFERNRIDAAQDRLSRDIARERQDAQRGDPNSPSSRRMQADVGRSVEQHRRIAQGVRSGELSDREAARAEWGQSRLSRAQARAGADGWIDRGEQQRLQRFEDRQRRRIQRDLHDRDGRRHDGARSEGWSRGRGAAHANAHSSWGNGRHHDRRGGRWNDWNGWGSERGASFGGERGHRHSSFNRGGGHGRWR